MLAAWAQLVPPGDTGSPWLAAKSLMQVWYLHGAPALQVSVDVRVNSNGA